MLNRDRRFLSSKRLAEGRDQAYIFTNQLCVDEFMFEDPNTGLTYRSRLGRAVDGTVGEAFDALKLYRGEYGLVFFVEKGIGKVYRTRIGYAVDEAVSSAFDSLRGDQNEPWMERCMISIPAGIFGLAMSPIITAVNYLCTFGKRRQVYPGEIEVFENPLE